MLGHITGINTNQLIYVYEKCINKKFIETNTYANCARMLVKLHWCALDEFSLMKYFHRLVFQSNLVLRYERSFISQIIIFFF